MNQHDLEYKKLCNHILDNGIIKKDRTGTGTISIFGYQMRFNLNRGFPLVTTKKVPLRLVAEELLWFLEGETDVTKLAQKNVHIWTSDAYRWYKQKGGTLSEEEFGERLLDPDISFDLGPIYGAQWRSWFKNETIKYVGDNEYPSYSVETIDQISNVIEEIKRNPDSRRLIVTAWNPAQLESMALPPCHVLFQFYVSGGKLSCQLYQRSADVFLGVPFNIASYALLTHMIAAQCGLGVGEFIHTIGDAHIYLNHIEQVEEQLTREPREAPILLLKPKGSIFDYEYKDITLVGYNPHPAIKGKVSVGT